jgi:hypothetical protein
MPFGAIWADRNEWSIDEKAKVKMSRFGNLEKPVNFYDIGYQMATI